MSKLTFIFIIKNHNYQTFIVIKNENIVRKVTYVNIKNCTFVQPLGDPNFDFFMIQIKGFGIVKPTFWSKIMFPKEEENVLIFSIVHTGLTVWSNVL